MEEEIDEPCERQWTKVIPHSEVILFYVAALAVAGRLDKTSLQYREENPQCLKFFELRRAMWDDDDRLQWSESHRKRGVPMHHPLSIDSYVAWCDKLEDKHE